MDEKEMERAKKAKHKFDTCKFRIGDCYCEMMKHYIENGYSILAHCGGCRIYEKL